MLLPTVDGTSRLATLEEFLGDGLTGLGSLLSLRRHLEVVVDRFQPFGVRPALLLIDIDGFKRVNSTHGRPTGDQVLTALARRLRSLVPGEGATYRTGADEFVALLDATEMIHGVDAAGRIQAEMSRPVDVDGRTIAVTVSAAVVMLGYRHRVDELLRDADVTMYRAKAEGGNRVDLYNWELDSWSTARKRDTERLQREVEELRLQNRVLSEALTTDLATGLPNDLAFEADLLQADAWRKRSGEAYSVLRVGVDGLYEQGPHYQTAAGEAATTPVAHAVRDTVRQSDRAYVLERGQIAVLLRGSGMKQAVLAGDRIRSAVHKAAAVHPVEAGRVLTVTIAAVEAGYRHPGPADVVEEADRLLRDGASQGGDRVVWPH